MQKSISLSVGVVTMMTCALLLGVSVASAHHNSPMYEVIEENENFDNMDMHDAAIENLTDNSSMDDATEQGTYTDVSMQDGATDGAEGETSQERSR